MREKLIEAIFDLASDEIETIDDAKGIAIMSMEELLDMLINLAQYYRELSNE
jgi:hypothetical protein